MIKKKMYIKCLKDLEDYLEWENKLDELGINLWENENIARILSDLVDLLGYCTKDEDWSIYAPSLIGDFIYNCNFCKENNIYLTNTDGSVTEINTAEDLWGYLVKCNPDIED